MKKIIVWLAIIVIVLVSGFFALNRYIYVEKQGDAGFKPEQDHKFIQYTINGKQFRLADGDTGESNDQTKNPTITKYFGNEAYGDLDGDGISDIAFILTQSGGGSGTFYYVVVALKTDDGYVGTNGMLLGDRIAPQTTEIRNERLIVNFATRKADEPMSAPVSVGTTAYFKVVDDMLEPILP